MPPTSGILSDFFGEEYERFMRALNELSGAEQARRQRDLARRGITGETPREISIPQWDDVLHVRSRVPLSPEDRDEWRASRREGRAPELPDDVLTELARRENRIESMRRSAQPEYAQSWGSMMTALDNVQDFLASVSVGARVVTKVGAKVGVRALPGVGWVKNGADLLNLAMFVGNLALPAFAALCHGPRQGLEAAIATGLVRASGKGLVSVLAGVNPLARVWRVGATASISRRIGAVGSALVVAQTTDQLWGKGVSLGPLVGYVMENVYAAEAQRRGEPIQLSPAPGSREWWDRAHPGLRDVPTAALPDRLKAAGTLRGAPILQGVQEVFTTEEHLAALVALHQAVGLVGEEWRRFDMLSAVRDVDTLPIPAPAIVWDSVSSVSLLPEPPPPAAFAWPVPGRPPTLTPPQLFEAFHEKIAIAISAIVAPVAAAPEGALMGTLVNEITESLWLSLTGDADAFHVELAPSQLALERLLSLNLIPHPGTNRDRAWAFWTDALTQLEGRRHALKTRGEWRTLAARYDVELLQLNPPSITALEPA